MSYFFLPLTLLLIRCVVTLILVNYSIFDLCVYSLTVCSRFCGITCIDEKRSGKSMLFHELSK